MPLFGSAFSPKKGQPRKATSLSNLNLDETERQIEFGLDYSPVKLRLSPHEMIFADGMWIAGIDHYAGRAYAAFLCCVDQDSPAKLKHFHPFIVLVLVF